MLEHSRLEKDSPIPLYYQLKELIRNAIREKGLVPGDPIPSERELVEQYQISRPTVRQAINELVNEGLLVREKGRGTFVAKPKLDQWFLTNMLSFTKEMSLKGLSHSTRVLDLRVVPIEPRLSEIFGEACREVVRLERLRFVEGTPAVVVTTYIPRDIAPDIERENLEQRSLYELIETKYGHEISYGRRVVEAVNASGEDAALLQVEKGAAIQLIKTTGYLSDNRPFEYSIARYRGDFNSFTVTLRYQR